VSWIDKTLPEAIAVTYDPSTTTGGSVMVTLVLSEPVQTILDWTMGVDATIRTKTYANNITTTVSFVDLVGNANSTGIQITWIDTDAPSVMSVVYTPSTATSGDVEVTITINKSVRKPSDWSGNLTDTIFTKVYTGNESESFTITDLVGNTGRVEVQITRIDKLAPEAVTVVYNPSIFTNMDVEVLLTTTEWIWKPIGRSGSITGTVFTKIYDANVTDTVTFYDHVYNFGSTGIEITWIDKTPVSGSVSYIPSSATSGDVTATVSFNKTGVTVTNNGGSTNYIFT